MNDSQTPPAHEPRPWGPIATVIIGILIAVSTLLAQIGLEILVSGLWASGPDPGRFAALPLGLAVSIDGMIGALAGAAAIWLAVGLRPPRRLDWVRVRGYLGLNRFAWRVLVFWTGSTLVYLVAMDAVSYWTGRPQVPDFIIEAYATSVWPLLFWIAIGVGAPLFEELLFRGFLLAGFRKTPLRTAVAAVAISAVWAGVHLQYGWYEIIWIFGLGLVFGAARVHGGSLWLPVILHMQCNLLATLQAARMQTP